MIKDKLTTLDLEIATMKFAGIRNNIVVPNVHWGINYNINKRFFVLHECDILKLTKNNYATEFEIKISKADLMNDKNKKHGHSSPLIRYLYFVVPSTLKEIALEVIPPRAGLITVERSKWNRYHYHTHVIRKPKTNTQAIKWTDPMKEKLLHLGNMRIQGLKLKIKKLEDKGLYMPDNQDRRKKVLKKMKINLHDKKIYSTFVTKSKKTEK